MKIQTQEDMIEFCKSVRGLFEIRVTDTLTENDVATFETLNQEMIKKGKLSKVSHLQQGIAKIERYGKKIVVFENPCLYPSPRILAENPELTGPMTGSLSNCYDPENGLVLFQMRGGDVSAPYRFQAAAAGMGYFREHPRETARRELIEEAGLKYPRVLFEGKAVDALPFMIGEKIPQLLLGFGFAGYLNGFPVYLNLDEIEVFEEQIKRRLRKGTIEKKEGYHFSVPLEHVERVVGELNDKQRVHGPIYESTINFLRALRESVLYPLK